MAEIDPVLEIEAQAIAAIVDELDYFQILKIEQWATPAEIKAAYYRESRTYHPDQFHAAPDGEAERAIDGRRVLLGVAHPALPDADALLPGFDLAHDGPEDVVRAAKLFPDAPCQSPRTGSGGFDGLSRSRRVGSERSDREDCPAGAAEAISREPGSRRRGGPDG